MFPHIPLVFSQASFETPSCLTDIIFVTPSTWYLVYHTRCIYAIAPLGPKKTRGIDIFRLGDVGMLIVQ